MVGCVTDKLIADEVNILSHMETEKEQHMHIYLQIEAVLQIEAGMPQFSLKVKPRGNQCHRNCPNG